MPEDKPKKSAPKTYDDLVRQVAERVWKLWQEDMRHERERRGQGVTNGR